MNELDRLDLALLNELQRDSRQSMQQPVEVVGLSAPPARCASSRMIQGYSARINREWIGLRQCEIAEINIDHPAE